MSFDISGIDIAGTCPSPRNCWARKISKSPFFSARSKSSLIKENGKSLTSATQPSTIIQPVLSKKMQRKSLSEQSSTFIPDVQNHKLNEYQASSSEYMSGSKDQIKMEQNTTENAIVPHSEDVDHSIDEFACSAYLKNDQKLEESTGTPPLNNTDTGYSSLLNQSFIGSLDSMKSFCADTAYKFNEEHVDICSYITTKSPDNLEGLAPCLKGIPEKKKAIISDVNATKEYMELLLKLERPLQPYQLEQKASQLEQSRGSESFHTRVAIESLRYIAFHSGGGGPNTVKTVMESYIDRQARCI